MTTLSASPEAIVIPTRSFYSARQVSPKLQHSKPKENAEKSPIASNSPKIKRRSVPNQSSIHGSKGVKHKIRRRHRHEGMAQRSSNSLAIDSILCNIRNDNLRNRIETKRMEKQQIETVHDILRKSQNPIELAKPLRALNMSDDTNNNNIDSKRGQHSELSADFSDFDCSSDEMITENIDELPFEVNNENEDSMHSTADNANTSNSTSRPETPNEHRKFFKSRQTASIPKEVRITENIKALVCNGKITLISEKRKPPKRPSTATEFSNAQAAVDIIIKNLDDQNESAKTQEHVVSVEKEIEEVGNQEVIECNDAILNEIELLESTTDYSEFRKRIPFNTNDPVRIEEQHFLLDFLITHDICNEETFNIFIADPENHKDEATKIVDEVLSTAKDDEDFWKRIPYNTDDPIVIEQQKHSLEVLATHNLLTEENFDIFVANRENRRLEANKILANIRSISKEDVNVEKNRCSNGKHDSNPSALKNSAVTLNNDCYVSPTKKSPLKSDSTSNLQNLYPLFYPGQCQPLVKNFMRRSRTWNAGHGLTQYQIDAGQKEFGAKQCKQCGLVYGAHEPEEERLHRDFHSSLHVLRFKGWIDEDRVADYPEWGRDGRIIRITDSASAKRRERLNEILKIVDKELGFSSYIIPKTFVAYMAIRNGQIVGFCLVQPLNKANKYIRNNGVDCCTVEEFDAKCGISRIWVAPLHRRMHIAKKLLQAVQMNTIMGEEIPLNKIAFSAPTEDGKRFAQKITGTESFLVYQ